VRDEGEGRWDGVDVERIRSAVQPRNRRAAPGGLGGDWPAIAKGREGPRASDD
jgi:hypothetical protein